MNRSRYKFYGSIVSLYCIWLNILRAFFFHRQRATQFDKMKHIKAVVFQQHAMWVHWFVECLQYKKRRQIMSKRMRVKHSTKRGEKMNKIEIRVSKASKSGWKWRIEMNYKYLMWVNLVNFRLLHQLLWKTVKSSESLK